MAADLKSLAGWSLTGWDMNGAGNFKIELGYFGPVPDLPWRYGHCDVIFRGPTVVDIDFPKGASRGLLIVGTPSETLGRKTGTYRLDFGEMGKLEIEATDYVLVKY